VMLVYGLRFSFWEIVWRGEGGGGFEGVRPELCFFGTVSRDE
jgi:hypothetical protein